MIMKSPGQDAHGLRSGQIRRQIQVRCGVIGVAEYFPSRRRLRSEPRSSEDRPACHFEITRCVANHPRVAGSIASSWQALTSRPVDGFLHSHRPFNSERLAGKAFVRMMRTDVDPI
jgi:hypothetical protein